MELNCFSVKWISFSLSLMGPSINIFAFQQNSDLYGISGCSIFQERATQRFFLEFWLDMNFVNFIAGFVQLMQITKLRCFLKLTKLMKIMHIMELAQLMDFMHIIIPHATNPKNTNAGAYQCP